MVSQKTAVFAVCSRGCRFCGR